MFGRCWGTGVRVTAGGKPGRARPLSLGGETGGRFLGTVPDTGGLGSGRGVSLEPCLPFSRLVLSVDPRQLAEARRDLQLRLWSRPFFFDFVRFCFKPFVRVPGCCFPGGATLFLR